MYCTLPCIHLIIKFYETVFTFCFVGGIVLIPKNLARYGADDNMYVVICLS